MEERQVEEKHDEGGAKVLNFRRRRATVASPPLVGNAVAVPQDPVSDQELADYRRYWPLMKRMLQEFEQVKATNGCPVMRSILGLD